jgi:hypothetical protein
MLVVLSNRYKFFYVGYLKQPVQKIEAYFFVLVKILTGTIKNLDVILNHFLAVVEEYN